MSFEIFTSDEGYTLWSLHAYKPDPDNPNNELYDVQYGYTDVMFFSYDKSLFEKIKLIFNE